MVVRQQCREARPCGRSSGGNIEQVKDVGEQASDPGSIGLILDTAKRTVGLPGWCNGYHAEVPHGSTSSREEEWKDGATRGNPVTGS